MQNDVQDGDPDPRRGLPPSPSRFATFASDRTAAAVVAAEFTPGGLGEKEPPPPGGGPAAKVGAGSSPTKGGGVMVYMAIKCSLAELP